MKMTRFVAMVFVLMLVLAVSAMAEAPLKVGYSVINMDTIYFSNMVDGMQAAAEERGIELQVFDSNYDANKAIEHIENFIASGVDAIIISTPDQEAPVDAVKKAREAGIVVMALDQSLIGVDVYYGVSDYEYGYLGGSNAGKWLNEKEAAGEIEDVLSADGKIEVCVGRYDSLLSVIDRAEGLKAGLVETYTGEHEIVFVSEQDAASVEDGYNLAQVTLTAHPDCSIFMCINDTGALGMYEGCLVDSGRNADNTCIVGVDAVDEALKLIAENTMYKGTVDINPKGKGGEALDILLKVMEEGPVDEQIPYQMIAVNHENIGDYVK